LAEHPAATASVVAGACALLPPDLVRSDDAWARLVQQRLGLTATEALLVGVCLVTAATDPIVASAGARLVRDCLAEALAALHTGGASVGQHAAHALLAVAADPPPVLGPVPPDLAAVLLATLQRRFPVASSPPILLPFLYPDTAPRADTPAATAAAVPIMADASANAATLASSSSLARVMLELGYGCCATAAVCANLLAQVSNAVGRPLDERDFAVALGMMARTQG
jgi:hypothetical protein